jgi:glycine oxidase
VARVVVIGGGVIGCAAAERLTLDGHRVTLLERDELAAHASGAAAGELSPHTGVGLVLEPAGRSLALFPALVERIERASGVSVEYHLREALLPALDAAQASELKASPGRWLEPNECRTLEPSLTNDVFGAVLQEEAHITPPRFVRALARTAVARGADVREATPVTGFDLRGAAVDAVITPRDRFAADWVVIAAGPWSKEVAGWAGASVEVGPQRGQLAALTQSSVFLTRTIFWSTGYLVPKPDGTVIAGSTHEDSGFDERPTAAGIRELLGFAIRLVPALETASLDRIWAGLRPVTPSGEPVVGRLAPFDNLIVATGHHRKGLMLAPGAAEAVARLIEA